MRYINQFFSTPIGEAWENTKLLSEYEGCIDALPVDEEERHKIREFVRFQLVGERSRNSVLEDWRHLTNFESRASAFERGAERALDALAERVAPAAESAGVQFDAVITTTATGNIMPGLSYRMAQRLGSQVRPDTLMWDLGNVGCTGSLKALNLARNLDPGLRNLLVVAVECPTTLVNVTATALDTWQGNCTFGDGAVAMWVSTDPEQGDTALELEQISYRQRSDVGLPLIRWAYTDYYTFALHDEKTFDRDVREHVVGALQETEAGWKEEPRWAIHPAGIALLVRISRKLGIPGEAIQPSVAHYREFSNQSSVSILQILDKVAADAPTGAAVNMLTMGAGFNVIYGRARKLR
jgi:predicted naringenin-chalcone synthase